MLWRLRERPRAVGWRRGDFDDFYIQHWATESAVARHRSFEAADKSCRLGTNSGKHGSWFCSPWLVGRVDVWVARALD